MEIRFAFRILAKRPFLNLIKVAGLSLALTGILLIILFIKNELTFDGFHKNSDRIFRLTVTRTDFLGDKHFARVYEPDYIPAMKNHFPAVENFVRISPVRGGVVKLNEKFIRISQAFQCDSTFFQVFTADLVAGNKDNILDDPATMVISESFAKRVFGDQNPVGQTLTLPAGQYYGKNTDFTVRGIMRDFPQNSHFHPEFIASRERGSTYIDWAWTYLLLNSGSDPASITEDFENFYSLHAERSDTTEVKAHLQPIMQIHLKSDKLREIENNSNITVLFTLIAASLILLFIALTNYVNLNLGMSAFSERFLQVGRVFGSSESNRLKYYLAESLIIITVSVIVSVLLTLFAYFWLLRHFSLNLLDGNLLLILSVIIFFILLCFIAGMLPFIKHEVTTAFTGKLFDNNALIQRRRISRALIVIQYAISTALIISVIVMTLQTRYALKSVMGNDSANLICFEDLHADVQSKFSLFKQEIHKYHSVRAVTAMLDPPGGEANDMFPFEMEGYLKDENQEEKPFIGVLPCDYSFADVFNLKFLAGEDFSATNSDNEGSGEFIINSSAMKRLGYNKAENIIGKNFRLLFEDVKIPSGKIIGVVDDFRLSGIKKRVEPLVLFKRNDVWLINFILSPEAGMNEQAIRDIARVWGEMFPEHPFEYRYVSGIYRNVYKAELLQTGLITLFTIIALFISSMGLLGLSLLTTQRRTKEIGIRVVNGASVREILTMLNWYFVKWILISFVIAIPIAWLGMQKWLENFVYKVPLSAWIFLLAGIITVLVALVTVSVQSWRAANRHPVDALRYE